MKDDDEDHRKIREFLAAAAAGRPTTGRKMVFDSASGKFIIARDEENDDLPRNVPGLSSQRIFLSYRREDAAPYARLLQLEFRECLPATPVFMDLDSIEPGLDFAEVIRNAVDSCAVLVALIGRQWATLADDEGHRRLDNPDDYVRFEVQAALERGVRVIPVLVDGARPLQQQQLPSGLQKLARLNALELSHDRFKYDVHRLVDTIQRVLAAAPGTL